MSEAITAQRNIETIRRGLLTSVSLLAILTAVSSPTIAVAEDASERPTVWIELGGQLESISGSDDPYMPPFATLSPPPPPYSPVSPEKAERPTKESYGAEGSISFTPNGSPWSVAASVRYGRSNNTKHIHQQTAVKTPNPFVNDSNTTPGVNHYISAPRFADMKARNLESHVVLDFMVGKDVGLGLFGHNWASTMQLGVRFAQFDSEEHDTLAVRPDIIIHKVAFGNLIFPFMYHNDYLGVNDDRHSFHGVGPSLSWSGMDRVAGDSDSGAIEFGWGVNGSVLFGRQKVDGEHSQRQRYYARRYYTPTPPYGVQTRYAHATSVHRARSVMVPNIGAFANISFHYSAAKVSFGYRGDFFFGATDGGVDARNEKNLGFYGPFAKISIGLGG